MTRFSRAKGSKSSNERVPEEATSWQDMKKQMDEVRQEREESGKRKEAMSVRKANYDNFLQAVEVVKSEWTDFPDEPLKKTKTHQVATLKESLIIQNEVPVKNKKKLKSKNIKIQNKDQVKSTEVKSQQRLTSVIEINGNAKDSKQVPLKLGQKNKQKAQKAEKVTKKYKKPKEELTDEDWKKIKAKRERRLRQKERRAMKRNQEIEEGQPSEANADLTKKPKTLKKKELNQQHNSIQNKDLSTTMKKQDLNHQQHNSEQNKYLKRKLPKVRDDKEHKRRKPYVENASIDINGTQVELAYFGAFLIKKEDANRLSNLRSEMRKKGIPRKQIEATLLLERRKAEKILSREKKKLCFNCRKSGHVLSSCPNLDNTSNEQQSIGTGICFKCGSTEHTHFECKVVRNQNYKFATCFICKEEGHISRQCPDNPRGIYPKGGACKVCGDVTHLRKDCPTFQGQQESATVTLGMTSGDNVEALDDETSYSTANSKPKTTNKIIKFKN